MPFSFSKLKGRITEKCGTRKEFARRMNLSERTVSLKLSNCIAWKQDEMVKACEILAIPFEDIPIYFFAIEVP